MKNIRFGLKIVFVCIIFSFDNWAINKHKKQKIINIHKHIGKYIQKIGYKSGYR